MPGTSQAITAARYGFPTGVPGTGTTGTGGDAGLDAAGSATQPSSSAKSAQALPRLVEAFRYNPDLRQNGHEIRVPGPTRDQVEMEMIRHSGTRRAPHVHPQVEAVRIVGPGEHALGLEHQRPELRARFRRALVGERPDG